MTELIHVVRGDFSIPEGEGTVVLQRYDESWSEWLDVTDETELEDRAEIKVVLLGKKEDGSEETKSQAVEPTKIDAGMFLFLCMFLFYIFKNQQMYVFNRLGIIHPCTYGRSKAAMGWKMPGMHNLLHWPLHVT